MRILRVDGTVTLLVNEGSGIYSTGIVLQVGDDPLSVEAADFDGDGDNDLAVIATDPILLTQAVLVFEDIGQSAGDLAFAAPITFTVGVDATANFLAVGDFNGDGEPDLVTVNTAQAVPEDGGATAGSVSVFLSQRPPCPGDVDFNGHVGIVDFLLVLANWQCQDKACPGDVDGDGFVGIVDFLLVLANWGDCP